GPRRPACRPSRRQDRRPRRRLPPPRSRPDPGRAGTPLRMTLPVHAERRGSDRREVRLVVEGCPGVHGAVDWATNLSLDGMRLERRLPLWPGTELELALHLPGGVLRARVVVVAGHPSGTGVRFVALDAAGRNRLAAYLAAE